MPVKSLAVLLSEMPTKLRLAMTTARFDPVITTYKDKDDLEFLAEMTETKEGRFVIFEDYQVLKNTILEYISLINILSKQLLDIEGKCND